MYNFYELFSAKLCQNNLRVVVETKRNDAVSRSAADDHVCAAVRIQPGITKSQVNAAAHIGFKTGQPLLQRQELCRDPVCAESTRSSVITIISGLFSDNIRGRVALFFSNSALYRSDTCAIRKPENAGGILLPFFFIFICVSP